MTMTTAQLTLLKAAIDGDPTLSTYLANGQIADIKRYFDEEANPAVPAWQTLSSDELIDSFDWTEIDALTDAKKNTLQLVLSRSTQDARKASVRSVLVDILPATSQANAAAAAKRNANRAEAVVSAGVAAVQGAKVLDWEGSVTLEDLYKARAL